MIKAVTPPHRTACSPNKSVSVSSLKVVSKIPALPPPIPFPYARPISCAEPEKSLSTAIKQGTPKSLSKTARTLWPGAFGAIIITSTLSGGFTSSYRIAKPWANKRISFSSKLSFISSL